MPIDVFLPMGIITKGSAPSQPARRNHAAPHSALSGSTWRHTQVLTGFYSSGVIGHEKKCSRVLWIMNGWIQKSIRAGRQSLHFCLTFYNNQNLFPLFSSLFSAKRVINHADVSFHKFFSPRVDILDKLVLGSFNHVTMTGRGGQNPVNHIYNTSHFSGTQPAFQHYVHPTLLQEFPFPSSQKEKSCTKHLHMLHRFPGDWQYGSNTCGRGPHIRTREVDGDGCLAWVSLVKVP